MSRFPFSPLTEYELDRRKIDTAKLIATFAASGMTVPEQHAMTYRDLYNSTILRHGWDGAVIPEPS